METKKWIQQVYNFLPEGKRDWVGIYWLESYLHPETQSTDLVVGDYIGPETPHKRIPIDDGLYGLAVREQRVINVADVRAEEKFLACSTTTRSEIVIPIRNQKGQVVAELNIGSDQLNSFDPATQNQLEKMCEEFGKELP